MSVDDLSEHKHDRLVTSVDDSSPLVSVIVPTKNSSDWIGKCLWSVLNQTYRKIEIIVIDNFSKDGTRDIALALGARVLVKGPERSAQLNYGAKAAKGKYLYRIDADFILEPNVIEEAVSICERQGFDAVTIHVISDPSISFWAEVRRFEREMRREDAFNVAARFVKREKFLQVGGFDANLVAGEDYDLHTRLLLAGARIGRISSCETHIGEPASIREVARNFFYLGTTFGAYLRKHRTTAVVQFSPVKAPYLRNFRTFARYPTLTIGFITYQVVRYIAAALGFCVSLKEMFRNSDSE
jgi:glycosyltransferase involved in cell wall biosynthesis